MQLRGEASSIQRVDSERFAKYSKIENPKLVKSSIKCEKLKYEIESPIESIPSEIYPNKKYKIASISSSWSFLFNYLFSTKSNNYNFLKLATDVDYQEDLMKISEDFVEEGWKDEPLIKEEESGPGDKTSLIQKLSDSNFPLFSSLAIVFVLGYFLFKTWKKRRHNLRFKTLPKSFKHMNRRDWSQLNYSNYLAALNCCYFCWCCKLHFFYH